MPTPFQVSGRCRRQTLERTEMLHMTRSSRAVLVAPTDHIRFEVRDGSRRVICNVSDEALEAVSGLAVPSTTVMRRKSFDRFRTLIDAAAKLKLKGMPLGPIGTITLTSDDLRSVPHEIGVPTFGSSPKRD